VQGRRFLQIAIDGPVGAGKSTVARLVAERLGILYVDTGAMYRALALAAKRRGVDWLDEKGVVEVLHKIEIKLESPLRGKGDGRNVTVLLTGEDVSWEIRGSDLGEGASVVSQYPEVRKTMVAMQKAIAANSAVIMEGRDIGTRVLPGAQIKIYMDADLEERVKRKAVQIRKLGQSSKISEIKKDVTTRDKREMTRKIDPLRPAKDAWILDTTGLSIEMVVDRIVGRVKELELGSFFREI